ncbi:MAG: tetratricopeptide repeat protein [Myxococcota bacterium]
MIHRVEALARATLAHALVQSAIHFPSVLEAMGLDVPGALERALVLAEEAIARCPELADGHSALGRVLLCSDEPGALDAAREALERALRRDPAHDPAEVCLATLDRESGDHQRALERLDRVVHAGNGHPLTFVLRGIVYAELGRTADARRDFSRVMTIAPESGIVDLELARADVWSEEQLEAIRARAEARLGSRYGWAASTLASPSQ